MNDQNVEQASIVEELKELGRQLTATLKSLTGSEQMRELSHELKDGLREAAQNIEEAWDTVRDRDEIQRLQARASDVADAFKTGHAQQEIREELSDALHALNARIGVLLERVRPGADSPELPATPPPAEPTSQVPTSYTGTTKRLEP